MRSSLCGNLRWLSLILVCLPLALSLAGDSGSTPLHVEVRITDQVVRQKIPRIGFNVCQNPIDDKSTMLQNCLNVNPGLESQLLFRLLFVASAGDSKSFEEPTAGDEQYRKMIPENSWKGAEFMVLDGEASGRKGRIANCAYLDGKRSVFTVEGEGPAFAAGDTLWLGQANGMGPLALWSEPANPELIEEHTHAPCFGGKSCVKLAAGSHIWLPTFSRWGGGRSGDRGGNADRFLQEKAYRISLWAKGTGSAKCSVRFVASSELGPRQSDDFAVTGTWKKYELIRKSDSMVNLVVVSSGGEVYLDDFIISEDDGGEPLAILPRVVNALADLKPGTLRLLGGARGESLDNWLAHPLERLRSVSKTAFNPRLAPGTWSYQAPDQPNLPESLDLCERSGASPWLVMGLAMTEEEWDGVLEYLAGPPESPYGAKRAQHGQPESWLKTFEAVYLEFGDEVWNRSKAPWNLDNPERYAAWAERIFSRVKKSKYYSPRIRLVANGWLAGPKWNEAVLKTCKSMDVLSCSSALELEKSNTAKNAGIEGLLAQMLAYPVAKSLPQLDAIAQRTKAANRAAALGSCEVLSSEPGFLGQERSLLRSQPAAVAILDELLLALAGGCEAVNYSRFAQGSDNSTHVDAHEMALHPAAIAIRLFNHHAGGMDLVVSRLTSGPQGGLAEGAPSLAAYAFKGQLGYSVLLLNRSPTQSYSAALKLSPAGGRAKCYCIASANPLANNLNQVEVSEVESEIDLASEVPVPAHGIVLIEVR